MIDTPTCPVTLGPSSAQTSGDIRDASMALRPSGPGDRGLAGARTDPAGGPPVAGAGVARRGEGVVRVLAGGREADRGVGDRRAGHQRRVVAGWRERMELDRGRGG